MRKKGAPVFSIFIYILAALYSGFALWAGWIFYQNTLPDLLTLTPSLIAVYGLCGFSCLCLFIILITLARTLCLSARNKVPAQPEALKTESASKKIPSSGKNSHFDPDGASLVQLPDYEQLSMISINLFVPDCKKALSFYEQAFGAISVHVHFSVPEGDKTARFKIGSALFALADENPEQNTKSALTLGGAPVCLQLFVEDVGKTLERALSAGADVMPPSTLAHPVVKLSDDTELGNLIDPFGITWSISKEDVHTVNIRAKETTYIAALVKKGA
ncbi:MAG: hypothetical protein FWG14_11040 [Peptococcaceae bacterium]|nr:hypothetical protein [Peptococcaceae bacterium]